MWVSIAIGQSNWSNWPVELDLEELFFHLRAKGNEIISPCRYNLADGTNHEEP